MPGGPPAPGGWASTGGLPTWLAGRTKSSNITIAITNAPALPTTIVLALHSWLTG